MTTQQIIWGQINPSPGSGGGGLTLLSSYFPSNVASLNITSQLSSTYDDYLLETSDFIPVTSTANLRLLASIDNGSSWLGGTNYLYSFVNVDNTTGGISSSVSTGAAQIPIGAGEDTTSANTSHAHSIIMRSVNSAIWKNFSMLQGATWTSSTNLQMRSGSGTIKTTSAINALQLIFSSGNISSGTCRLYGIQKS